MTRYLLAALAVAVTSAALALSFRSEAYLQEPPATIIDSRLAPEIERDGRIEVLISLKQLDPPMEDWTDELRRENAAKRQDATLATLTDADFTLTGRFNDVAALGGYITASGLEKLRNHPDVAAIGAAELGSLSLSESVPLVNADTVHAAGYDGSGIDIAVLDTGIDTDHPDLSDSIVDEMCFIQYTNCGPFGHAAEDVDGHGTNLSGIITPNGTVPGVPLGIAPEAGIYAYRVTIGSTPNLNAVAAALEYLRLRNYPVDFVNMSFHLTAPLPGNCDAALNLIELELAGLRLNGGVVPFASSGNQGDKNGMGFPACNQFVVSVGAVYDSNVGTHTWSGVCAEPTAADKVACASNPSSSLDLLAPGCSMTSTGLGGGASTYCGTSQASPAAAAVAALLKDAQPSLTADQIELRMKATGKWVYDTLAERWTNRIDARVAILIDDNDDWDGDGCKNGSEFGDDYTTGGERNPLNSYDFYDTGNGGDITGEFSPAFVGDGKIDLANDILGVQLNYTGNAGYEPGEAAVEGTLSLKAAYDRSAFTGPNHWNRTGRDGKIDLANDILGVQFQYTGNAGCGRGDGN